MAIKSKHSKLPVRPAGKSLKDIELDEQIWKPDFDIVSRYQAFETEIIRLSLLGITGYGFSYFTNKNGQYKTYISKLAKSETITYTWIIITCIVIGISTFPFPECLVTLHRAFATDIAD